MSQAYPRGLNKEDCKFKASLGYRVSSGLAWALSQKQKEAEVIAQWSSMHEAWSPINTEGKLKYTKNVFLLLRFYIFL